MSENTCTSIALKIADEMTDHLNGQIVGQETLSVVRKLIPDLEISKVKNLKILVVPHGMESKIIARGGSKERIVTLDVGIMKRSSETELDQLIDLAQGIADLMEGYQLTSGICTEISFSPLYDSEFWLQQNCFFSVIVARIKVM